MKAAVLTHYGSPDQFAIKAVDTPEPEEGEVLIRNRASSVNPVDAVVRKGTFRLATGLFNEPIIGCDYCGTVVRSRSSRFNEGDDVFGVLSPTSGHAYAEFVVVDGATAVLKPTNLSFTEAATIPLTALTAWQSLLVAGGLKAGDHVLINGCTGGVGHMAVQIAKHVGATVTGTCRGANVAFARELGCDTVIDYETESIPTDNRYPLIFDAAGKMTWSDAEASLTADGLLVIIRPHVDNLSSAVTAAVDLARSRMKLVVMKPNAPELATIKDLLERGILKPRLAQTFPLEEVGLAHSRLEEGGFVGKLAIAIA